MLRILRRLVIVAAAGYLAVLLSMYVGQRSLLFATYDGGTLAAANWIAIPGSKRLKISTSDGEEIAGWYLAPKPGKPVFLFFHGKGGGLERKKGRWSDIRNYGAGVLAISYRGYPGSTGRPSEAGLLLDADAAYAWLRKHHAPNQIVLHGLSLGTGVAVALATKVNAIALVLEAPFTSAVDIAAERYPLLPVRWLMSDTFLSRERIPQVNMPVIVFHGKRDKVIPFRHAEMLSQRAREPKKFVPLSHGGHNNLVRHGIYAHIWKFLENQAQQTF